MARRTAADGAVSGGAPADARRGAPRHAQLDAQPRRLLQRGRATAGSAAADGAGGGAAPADAGQGAPRHAQLDAQPRRPLQRGGRRPEALRLTEQVVEARRRTLGEEHPDTLNSMHNLAVYFSEAGRRPEALRLTEQVVEPRRRTLGEEHPDTLNSMHNLAVRFSEAGDGRKRCG